MSRQRFDPLPSFPIEDVLRALGADDIPTGYGWIKMSCPFHEDRRPSAAVNHDIGGFRCFSCGRSGDAIKLLETELGLSWIDALSRAKAITGIESGEVRRKPRPSSTLLSWTRDQ